MDITTAAQRIQELEKTNRILAKQLSRSESNRQQIELQHETSATFLRQVIQELQTSQVRLEERTQTLETTLQELRLTQGKLVASEKMSALGTMVAGVAHEINNPINFVHGNLSHVNLYSQDLLHLLKLYQQEFPATSSKLAIAIEAIDLPFLEQDLKKTLQSMSSGTDRIRKIVNSLKIFARLDEAAYKYIDLHESLNSTVLMIQNRLDATEDRAAIQLVTEYRPIPQVECYASALNQVFLQLLNNAIDAINDQSIQHPIWKQIPQVRIQTNYDGATDSITITIGDNGCGIPETIRPKIFDPFFTTKPIGQGTGLGLSTSYQTIVGQHKGQLYCRSVPAHGTEFVIHLPLRQSLVISDTPHQQDNQDQQHGD
ncbi:sensor histidine kinase [filamentous cyanobacterium LEGE 11480]|uniref:histidine kinase n=1 Tax=Romeriopsis navalis LEGE 11480 TaxID=2777977 RepID=A0A928VQ74_9CYAN|nr:ATP-binding protein [Romeriopsis navalis]MBE9030580.1 sensor histidine kinase [Romeriopsis navalis LEGE 11480]